MLIVSDITMAMSLKVGPSQALTLHIPVENSWADASCQLNKMAEKV